jgi:hypothetical protein
MLKVGGELYLIESDADYLLRAILSSELTLEDFNAEFNTPTFLNMDMISRALISAGFAHQHQKQWFVSDAFEKKHYEIIISALKADELYG